MEQANRYLTELFEAFEILDTHGVVLRPIPTSCDMQGHFFRYEKHFVYWKRLGNGDIGIVTEPHEHLHQIERFREDFRQS
ncbi:type II toxin-antitoxin system RelE/ParE family toxin [Zoogloea sp.]|uniref:type II toxin-antitoxin system RelE/ParE family toxin n=1 Tax=Zoogloea sp. TaxID=49181 RepID=UPI0035AF0A6B